MGRLRRFMGRGEARTDPDQSVQPPETQTTSKSSKAPKKVFVARLPTKYFTGSNKLVTEGETYGESEGLGRWYTAQPKSKQLNTFHACLPPERGKGPRFMVHQRAVEVAVDAAGALNNRSCCCPTLHFFALRPPPSIRLVPSIA